MSNNIRLSDFDFSFTGYGHYKVTYQSPKTGKKWSKVTTDTQLIDATKNEDNPTKKSLTQLKRLCKGVSNYYC